MLFSPALLSHKACYPLSTLGELPVSLESTGQAQALPAGDAYCSNVSSGDGVNSGAIASGGRIEAVAEAAAMALAMAPCGGGALASTSATTASAVRSSRSARFSCASSPCVRAVATGRGDSCGARSGSLVVAAAGAGRGSGSDDEGTGGVSRRVVLGGLLLAGGCLGENSAVEPAAAAIPAFRNYVDRLDGYTFRYPAGWIQVRGAGADVFFRDPVNLDENLLVEISSPSSSKFNGVEDLGTPEQAAKKVLQQYLTEFMSTRIGVRREANVTATKSRVGDDGRLYYEVEVVASSYANNNQLAVMPESRVAKLEWSRRYLSVLGVENNRLYQLRLQVPENVAELEEQDLRQIMNSFGVLKLAV